MKASVNEIQKICDLICEKFFPVGYSFKVAKGGGIESYDVNIIMPNTNEHGFDILLSINIEALDDGFDESTYADPDKLLAKRYIHMLKLLGENILYIVGTWTVDERTTRDTNAFLKYYHIYNYWTQKALHQDENEIMQIARVMMLCSNDRSFRIHYDKTMPPLSAYVTTEVRDARAAYEYILHKYEIKGNGIKVGHYLDKSQGVALVFSFCSPSGKEIGVTIYRNEMLHEVMNFNLSTVTCWSFALKTFLYEKVIDCIQKGGLTGEDKTYFLRRLLAIQKDGLPYGQKYQKFRKNMRGDKKHES